LDREIVAIESVHPTGGTYSHAVRAGDVLYIAGQVAKDQEGNVVGIGDPEAQCRQVFANLAAILEEAGSGLEHVVKFTTYLTHPSYIEAYRKVRNETLSKPMPANTLVIVESLVSPELLVEIDAVAVVPGGRSSSSSA